MKQNENWPAETRENKELTTRGGKRRCRSQADKMPVAWWRPVPELAHEPASLMSDDNISFIQPRLGGGAVASALWPRPGMAVLTTQAIATVVPANGVAERAELISIGIPSLATSIQAANNPGLGGVVGSASP